MHRSNRALIHDNNIGNIIDFGETDYSDMESSGSIMASLANNDPVDNKPVLDRDRILRSKGEAVNQHEATEDLSRVQK